MNRRKSIGIILAFCGVALARSDAVFAGMEQILVYGCKTIGTVVALGGLCVFASGINTTVKKITVCRSCGGLFADTEGICTACREKNRSTQAAEN